VTGIFHIVLARKPLEGTIAENCLQWGCGALWIDGTRVMTTDNLNGGMYSPGGKARPMPGDTRTGAALGMFSPGAKPKQGFVQPLGRFPANLILGHCDGCLRKGTKKVKGSLLDHDCQAGKIFSAEAGTGGLGITRKHGHTDADGKETVEDWDCEETCVTMGFPLTGVSTGGKTGAVGSGGRYNGGWDGTNPGISAGGFGDSGSASRFFFNFSEQEADE